MNGFFRIPFPPGSTAGYLGAGILRHFVGGPENRLVRTAVESLGREPLEFNPLLLYGSSGTGKSHLSHTLAEQWRARYPQASVLETTATEFGQDYSAAIAAQQIQELKTRHRAVDLAVIENIDALPGKSLAQRELTHLFDALAPEGVPLLLTSRKPLSEVEGLEPALRSRLTSGLVVQLAPPAPRTRLVLLQELADSLQIDLAPSAAELLAERMEATVPRLRGALISITTHNKLAANPRSNLLNNSPGSHEVSLAAAKEYLRSSQPREVELRKVASCTARHYQIKTSDLKSPSRRSSVVSARAVAMFLSRRLTNKSLGQIGDYFGGRDHTTVLYNCRRTERLLEEDAATREAVARLESQLRPG